MSVEVVCDGCGKRSGSTRSALSGKSWRLSLTGSVDFCPECTRVTWDDLFGIDGEEWRTVPGHDGYEVSDLGRVRSYIGKGKPRTVRSSWPMLLKTPLSDGYPNVTALGKVHKAVLSAFVGPAAGLVVRHLNDVPTDNRLSNLAYGTVRENNLDTVANGKNVNANRTHCKRGHEFTAENTVTSGGNRACRICRAMHSRARRLGVSINDLEVSA